MWQRVYGEIVCKCEKCGKVWMSQDNERIPNSCPNNKCRTKLWDKKKVKKMELTQNGYVEEKEPRPEPTKPDQTLSKQAIACAIVQKFNCGLYRQKIDNTPLCKTCFTLDVWNNKVLQQNLLDAMSEEEVTDNVDTTPLEPPKTAEQVFRQMEQDNQITGGEAPVKDEKAMYTANAKTCRDKYQLPNGEWHCDFFGMPHPKYPYCTRCWELPEIWKNKAAGGQR